MTKKKATQTRDVERDLSVIWREEVEKFRKNSESPIREEDIPKFSSSLNKRIEDYLREYENSEESSEDYEVTKNEEIQ